MESGLYACNSAEYRIHCSLAVLVAENGRPGHEPRRSRRSNGRGGPWIDTTVDLNSHRKTTLANESRYVTNLRHNRFYEFLPAKTGIHAHDENVVAELDRGRKHFCRRRGIE